MAWTGSGVRVPLPPPNSLLVARRSYLVKAKQTLISIKGNTKKDTTEPRGGGKRNEEERDLPSIRNGVGIGYRGNHASSTAKEGGYKHFFTPNLSVEPFAQVGYCTAGVRFAFTFGANVGYSF